MQRIPGDIPRRWGAGDRGVKPFQMSHTESCAWGQRALTGYSKPEN